MLLKKQYAKVLAAVLLLLTFAAGQLIVIAHTHAKATYSTHQGKKDNTDDKCGICSHNSHVQLFLQHQQTLLTIAVTRVNTYHQYNYAYKSVSLHQSCNRGPPVI